MSSGCLGCVQVGYRDLAVDRDGEWLVVSGYHCSVDDLVDLGRFLGVIKSREEEERDLIGELRRFGVYGLLTSDKGDVKEPNDKTL